MLAVAAGTGDVLMSRLREGRANTARGAAHFLRETVGRVHYAGVRGQLTVRVDRGFYAIVAVCRKMDVRYSITIRQHKSLRNLIETIPEADWTPIPYWMDGAADVAETTYIPFQNEPDPAPVRLIVRRVKPTPGSQPGLPTKLRCHAVTAGADSPVSRLCTARNAGVLMLCTKAGLCTKASNHKPVTTRLVRRHLWMSPGGFSMSRRDSDSEKVPAALYDRLTDTPTYAARMYKVQKSQ